jgi:predicted MFS family arabinose efflux permease
VAVGRIRTRSSAAFFVVGGFWLAAMAAANLATPLYAVYERRFGFSHAALTLVFATYALVLAPSLLLFGQLSDRLGRRRVMAAGLLTATAGVLLFALATGIAWLFAARAVQGLAVGMLGGAASAALVELDPRPEEHVAALVAALAQAGGSAAGPILAGALAEWAPAPRVLCYVLVGAVTAAGALAVLRIPEPGTVTTGRWRVQRPHVPRPIRVRFARLSITSAAVWAICALFLSVVPSYAADLLDTDDLALLGSVSGLILVSSCAAQLAARRLTAFARAQAAGLLLGAAGLVALVVAFPLHSLAFLLVAAMLAGAGHGIAFLAAQSEVNLAAPPDSRGEVNAAFYTCTYLGVAFAVIGTGLLTLTVALSTAVTVFAAAMGAVLVATAVWHLRDAEAPRGRPAQRR